VGINYSTYKVQATCHRPTYLLWRYGLSFMDVVMFKMYKISSAYVYCRKCFVRY